ncbi:4-hydroxy-tetrahydrodipicolinate synthase [Treponema socranskii]|uniref:4-hydroxy-tetrahydrodipicolinate synthase n=1 Tax=Treponema socranskii TaxID=53419 RepID=UPI003D948F19
MEAKRFVPTGIIPPVITPLNDDETANLNALKHLIAYLLDGGVHAIFVLGTTGEFFAFTSDEKKAIIETALEAVNGKVPVYAGTGGITTKEVISLTQMAEKCGADAVSILTPMFISPSQDDLYVHYKTIAESTDLPIIMYNNEPRTGVGISVQTVERLAQIDNIVGIKDSSGDFDLTGEYIRVTKDNSNFHVLQGHDTHILAGLTYGASGAIAATANIAPKLAVAIYDNFRCGNMEKALEAQFALAPLRMAFTLGTFPAVIKDGLQMLGIAAGPCKSPIRHLTTEESHRLYAILTAMHLI